VESHHDLISLFEHDLRANAVPRLSRGKTGIHFPDHALADLAGQGQRSRLHQSRKRPFEIAATRTAKQACGIDGFR
jgi:hypothetical protein